MRLGCVGRQPAHGVVQRLGAGLAAGMLAGQGFHAVAGGGHGLVGGEGFQACGLDRVFSGAEGFRRRLLGRLRLIQRWSALVDLGFKLGQARALGQAYGGRTRRLGAADEPVPAIEVALHRHQARAGRQGLSQPGRVGLGRDTAKSEARGQLCRRLNMIRKRRDPGGPGRGGRIRPAPIGGGLGVEGRVQIVA